MRYTERYLLFCLPSVIYIYQVDKIIETHFTVYYTLQLNSSTDSIVTDDTPLYNNVNKTVCITFMRVGSLQHCCIRHYSFFARGIYSNIQQLCVGTWMHTEKCAVSSSTIRLIQWCQSDLTKKILQRHRGHYSTVYTCWVAFPMTSTCKRGTPL